MGTCGGCNLQGDTKEKKILCAVDGQWYEESHSCKRWTEYSYGMSRSERLADAKSIKEREDQEIRHQEVLQESQVDREHQEAMAERPPKRSRWDWALSIIAIFIASWAAFSAHEVNLISKDMMSIQEGESRPYISVESAKVKQYPSIDFYNQKTPLQMSEIQDEPIFGTEIVLKNIGTHPAKNLYAYVVVWEKNKDNFRIKMAGISRSNELFGENISALYTHVWPGAEDIPEHYIVVGVDYQDSITEKSYPPQRFYYTWSGIKNGLYRQGFNILSSIEEQEIREILSDIEQAKNGLKDGPMGYSQITIDSSSHP